LGNENENLLKNNPHNTRIVAVKYGKYKNFKKKLQKVKDLLQWYCYENKH
jgi:hypothetical protein